jgi:hypothetical protein
MSPKNRIPRPASGLLTLCAPDLSLTACEPSESDQRRYEITKEAGSSRDQCTPAREVQAAHLKEMSEDQYRRSKPLVDVACFKLELDARNGIV